MILNFTTTRRIFCYSLSETYPIKVGSTLEVSWSRNKNLIGTSFMFTKGKHKKQTFDKN